jgi:uncharacterized protein (TIGR03067 family)
MKNICRMFLAIAATSTGMAAEEPDDAKAVQGTWVPVKAELGGQPLPDALLKTITLKTGKGEYEVTIEGAPGPDKGTYTLDTAANPKGMTIKGVKGPNQGKTFPCIYEVTADTFRVCYDLSGAKRPTEFKTSAGTKLYLVTYNRKK